MHQHHDLSIQNCGFDYTAVDVLTASNLRKSSEVIKNLVKSTMSAIITVGDELIAAKQKLGHGQFVTWVEAECGFGHGTALNYMRAAQLAKSKSATVANLPPAAVYRLAAPSTPAAVVERVERIVAAGERIGHREVVAMIDEARVERSNELYRQKRQAVSPRTRRKHEAQKAEAAEARRREEEQTRALVGELIADIGTDHALSIVRCSAAIDPWTLLEELKRQLSTHADKAQLGTAEALS